MITKYTILETKDGWELRIGSTLVGRYATRAEVVAAIYGRHK